MPSSRNWLKQHANDHYVKQARKLGLRSRAAFKLKEIQTKHKFIKANDHVIDLGAAPGSWSEMCMTWLNSNTLVACDLLEMQHIDGVNFIQGDFNEPEIQKQILENFQGLPDVIISDMSPNKTGVKKVDQWQSTALCEVVLEFASEYLRPGGNLLFKSFHGDGFEEILKIARSLFGKVKSVKPDASRKNSTEIYLLCLAKKDKA